jgi:signal transduction histidine kinase
VPLGDRDDRLIFSILAARDGGTWLGGDGWVVHLDDTGAQRVIGAAEGLPPSQVYDLHEDAGGALWIGTADAGLVRHRDGVARVVGARDGLFDDTVFTVLDDGQGQLWMSSNKGVYRVAIQQLDAFFAGERRRVESTVFGRRDGMKSPECNGPAGYEAPDGRLWFPTIQGVVSVDPRERYGNEVPPPVVIEAVRAGDVLASAPVDGLRVEPGIERLELHYTALSFAAPERMRFRYRLHGFDTDWIDAGTRRSAFYTNIPPGSYRFQVIASNDSGVWNEAGASLAVLLAPAFHQTWYFRALLGLAAASALGLAYFWRVRRLEARQRELADLVATRTGELSDKNQVLTERTRELDEALHSLREAEADLVRAERMASVATLVQGIAHELNNPVGFLAANVAPLRRYCEFLSRVAGELSDGRPRSSDEIEALTRLSAKKDLPFVARDLSKVLDDMGEGARRIKLIVGDLQRLTSATPRGVERVDLARAARQSVALVSPRLPPGARVDLDIGEVPPVTARAGELEQVVVNLLDNATRAVGPDGRIEVQVAAEDEHVRVTVADDGCGMDDETRTRALEPFFTTRAAGEGSGLGLAIAAAIVAGHKGSIAIDSEPGKGTRVVLRVPLDADVGP